MLFKNPVFFLLPCAFSYFVVTVEATTSQWTDQELILNKPFLENDESYHNDNNATVGSYFSSWMITSWNLPRKMWHQWGRRYSDKVNAQTCIEQLMIFTDVQRRPYQVVVNNQCHCGSYFGNQGMAQTTMRDAKDYIDQWGVPKTGYVTYAPIGGNQNERFGIAVHCHGDLAWVKNQLAGKHEPNEKDPVNGKN